MRNYIENFNKHMITEVIEQNKCISLKNAGEDGIVIISIKAGGITLIKALKIIFNMYIEERKVLSKWMLRKNYVHKRRPCRFKQLRSLKSRLALENILT